MAEEPRTINIIERSALKPGKKGAYFTVKDETDKTWICWHDNLYDNFQVGSVVSILWEKSDNQKYLDRITGLVNQPAPETPQSQKKAVKKELPQEVLTQVIAPQERGMWYKELGELIRWQGLPKDNDFGKAVRVKYLAEMMRVLGTLDKNTIIECLKTWGITATDLQEKKTEGQK